MKTFYAFLLGVCAIAIALVSCKKSSPPEPEKPQSETVIENLVEELEKQPEVAAFSKAFKNVTLSEDDVKDGLTILAPTNEALQDYRPNAVSYSKNSTKILADTNAQKLTQERLKDHIVKGVLTKADFTDGKTLISLSGKELRITIDGEQIKVNGVVLTLVSSSGSQIIYTIPQVLTNTESKIYLPVKLTYTVDDTINAGITNITYVENTQLIASIEDGAYKEVLSYNGGKLHKSVYYQGNTALYETAYILNANGDIERANTKEVRNGQNIGYQLIDYNSSRKVASVKDYSMDLSDEILDKRVDYEYDMAGNIKKSIETFYRGDTVSSVSTYDHEYDSKNGIFKHVKSNMFSGDMIFHIINNVIKTSDDRNIIDRSIIYNEYNSSGYPTKYTENRPIRYSTPATVTVEYIVR